MPEGTSNQKSAAQSARQLHFKLRTFSARSGGPRAARAGPEPGDETPAPRRARRGGASSDGATGARRSIRRRRSAEGPRRRGERLGALGPRPRRKPASKLGPARAVRRARGVRGEAGRGDIRGVLRDRPQSMALPAGARQEACNGDNTRGRQNGPKKIGPEFRLRYGHLRMLTGQRILFEFH